MARPDDQFLDQFGIIHELHLSPAGPPEDPFPFLLTVNDGHGESSCLLHRDNAAEIVGFFAKHGVTGAEARP